jgi:hypothetical protein
LTTDFRYQTSKNFCEMDKFVLISCRPGAQAPSQRKGLVAQAILFIL